MVVIAPLRFFIYFSCSFLAWPFYLECIFSVSIAFTHAPMNFHCLFCFFLYFFSHWLNAFAHLIDFPAGFPFGILRSFQIFSFFLSTFKFSLRPWNFCIKFTQTFTFCCLIFMLLAFFNIFSLTVENVNFFELFNWFTFPLFYTKILFLLFLSFFFFLNSSSRIASLSVIFSIS